MDKVEKSDWDFKEEFDSYITTNQVTIKIDSNPWIVKDSKQMKIKEIIEIIRNAKIVIHGIGDAMVMALRRKVNLETREILLREGALAEAFGYYFDHRGHVIHQTPTMGLRLEDLDRMEVVIGVAGGKSKGESIAAVLRHGQEDILITDEGAALEILKHM